MRLIDLEPEFIRYETRPTEVSVCIGDPKTWKPEDGTRTEIRDVAWTYTVHLLVVAQGIRFLCPVCFAANGGPVGTHAVEVAFEGRGVAPNEGSHGRGGQPTRWTATGTDFHDLTLSPSIDLSGPHGGCQWHGFVTSGQVA